MVMTILNYIYNILKLIIKVKMDEEETPWHTSNNYSNRRSSVVSLERNSGISRERSLNHKKSFVQVLNLDGMEEEQLHTDLFQQMLIENQRRSFFRSSNNSQYGEMEIEEPANHYNRRSSNNKIIYHDCICQGSCIDYHCACFEAENQLCLQGSCCQGCIELKNKILSQFQIPVCICKDKKGKYANCKCFKNGTFECNCSCPENTKNKQIKQSKKQKNSNGQTQQSVDFSQQGPNLKKTNMTKNQQKNKQKNKVVCYCKKSHCLKKYCCCYAMGQQCNQQCSCTECHNKFQEDQDKQEKELERQRFGRHDSDNQEDQDIDQYIQDKDYENYEMPKSMQFQHPDIAKSFRH